MKRVHAPAGAYPNPTEHNTESHEIIRAMEKDGALIDTRIEDGQHVISIVDKHWRMFEVVSSSRFDWQAAYEIYQARMKRPGGRRLRVSRKVAA